jgi:uncharacterized membrane protein YtjA (UPF0391 family)
MRKTIFKIGVILLFAFFVIALIRDNPQSYGTTSQTIAGMQAPYHNLSYNGQNYTMDNYNYSIQANVGDTIQLTVLVYANNGVWATAFFEQKDGTPVFAYETVTSYPATYSMIVGSPNLLYYGTTKDLPDNQGGGRTAYLIQLGVPQQETVNATWNNGDAAGDYLISVTVYSNSLFLTYEATAIIFLIAGVITTILGYYLKPKKSEIPENQSNPLQP